METTEDDDAFNRLVFWVFMALTLTGMGFWVWALGRGIVWLLKHTTPWTL